jgi:hypothetical protein
VCDKCLERLIRLYLIWSPRKRRNAKFRRCRCKKPTLCQLQTAAVCLFSLLFYVLVTYPVSDLKLVETLNHMDVAVGLHGRWFCQVSNSVFLMSRHRKYPPSHSAVPTLHVRRSSGTTLIITVIMTESLPIIIHHFSYFTIYICWNITHSMQQSLFPEADRQIPYLLWNPKV